MFRALLDPAALRLLAGGGSESTSIGLHFGDDGLFMITGRNVVNLGNGSEVAMDRTFSLSPRFPGMKLARAAWILEHWLSHSEPGRTAMVEIDETGLKISVAAAGPTYSFEIPVCE